MSKKQVSSAGRISPKAITFKPPLKGLNDHAARNVLPPQASEFLLNVVPRDRMGVLRISKRVGFAKAFANPFDGGGSSSSSSVEPTQVAGVYTFDGGNLSLAGNYTPNGTPGINDRVISLNKLASGGSNSAMWDLTGGTVVAACSFDGGGSTMSGLTLVASVILGGGKLTDGIGSGGGIVKIGTNALVLSGTSSTYDTPPQVLGGVLTAEDGTNPVPLDGDIIVSGGSFDLAGNVVTSGNVRIANGAILWNSEILVHGSVTCTGGTVTLGNGVGGIGVLSIDASSTNGYIDVQTGTMDLINSFVDNGEGLVKTGAGLLLLSQQNTVTGNVQVQGGIMKLGINGAMPANQQMTIGAGGAATFDLGGYDQTLDRIDDYGSINSVVQGPGTLTVELSSDQLLTGNVQYVDINLVKSGTNTMVYTTAIQGLSTLSVNGGIFRLASNQDFFAGNPSYIASGATFDANGFTTNLDAVYFHVSSGGMLYLPANSIVNGGLLNGLNAITVPSGGAHVTFDVALETDTSIDIGMGSTASGSIVTNGHALSLDGTGTFDGSVT